MYFKPIYDTDTSEIEKFNDTLSIEKYHILIKNIHISWYEHLMKVQDSKYDVSATYDLSNHLTVPTLKSNNHSTLSNGSFHARFCVLSVLLTPAKLRIYDCAHRHHCESVVHSGSMIDIIIPKKSFIILHSALFHCGTLS